MKWHRTLSLWLICLLAVCHGLAVAAPAQSASGAAPSVADEAPLFRVFLQDGSSLVSYGELARVDDRVVFSMPTSASASAPQLQLVNIAWDRVDWERTANYAEAVRSQRYLSTRAETGYALLTTEIAQALNDVTLTDDPARRLAIVERARKSLADWPAAHYNYKRDDIQQMLGTLDEAIAVLRAATGSSTFDLAFVAAAAPAAREPILPAPSPREAIEQTVRAAQLTASPVERVSLLTVAANALTTDAAALPSAWLVATRAQVTAQIAREFESDRKYQALGTRVVRAATARARLADVMGVQRVLTSIAVNDAALGSERPDVVLSIVAAVEEQLEGARRLRLERDRWALRAPGLRAYRLAMAGPLYRIQLLTPLLENIKSLAGSSPDALSSILRATGQIRKAMERIQPPSELRDAHELFVSAVQLADGAAKTRREAAINGNMARAWDASSAAAGSLMLAARARNDMQVALRPLQIGP